MPEMSADPPKNQANLVLRVVLDRQPPHHHKAAVIGDLTADVLDHRTECGNLEMLTLQIVEAEPGRLYARDRLPNVVELRCGQLDRVVVWRGEIGNPPSARIRDRRVVKRRRRGLAVGRPGHLAHLVHDHSPLADPIPDQYPRTGSTVLTSVCPRNSRAALANTRSKVLGR